MRTTAVGTTYSFTQGWSYNGLDRGVGDLAGKVLRLYFTQNGGPGPWQWLEDYRDGD